jgi:hypothetical protein
MNVTLIFPPYVISYQPYSSVPCLAAYLRAHGYPVKVMDENIEFINEHIQVPFFKEVYQEVSEVTEKLQKKVSKEKHELLLKNYIDNCFRRDYLTTVSQGLEASLETLRDRQLIANEFRANKARDTVNKAQNLIHQYLKFNQLIRHHTEDLTLDLQWDYIKEEMAAESEYKEYFLKKTIPEMIASAPEVVGISVVFEDQLIPAFILAQEMRNTPALRSVHITLGGPAITTLRHDIMQHKEVFSFIDSCIVYEGEHALLKLLTNLELKRGLDEVPNLIYLKDGKVVGNGIVMIKDLDELPTPDFDGLPLANYFSPSLVPILRPARGCYWNKCAFCNSRYLNNYHTYSMRSAERTFEDFVALHHKYKVNAFTLWEEATVPKLLKRLAQLVRESNYQFKWFAEARLDKTYTESFFKTLYQGGCRSMVFGLESGNQRVQDVMNKGYDLKICREVIKNCSRAKIRVYLTLMMGFPSETLQEAMDTINFVSENNRYIYHAGVSHFGLRKHTDTYEHPEKFGISVTKDVGSFSALGNVHYGIKNKGMTLEESMVMYKMMTKKLFELGVSRSEPECHYLLRC